MKIEVKVYSGLEGQARNFINNLQFAQNIDSILLNDGEIVWIGAKDEKRRITKRKDVYEIEESLRGNPFAESHELKD